MTDQHNREKAKHGASRALDFVHRLLESEGTSEALATTSVDIHGVFEKSFDCV